MLLKLLKSIFFGHGRHSHADSAGIIPNLRHGEQQLKPLRLWHTCSHTQTSGATHWDHSSCSPMTVYRSFLWMMRSALNSCGTRFDSIYFFLCLSLCCQEQLYFSLWLLACHPSKDNFCLTRTGHVTLTISSTNLKIQKQVCSRDFCCIHLY